VIATAFSMEPCCGAGRRVALPRTPAAPHPLDRALDLVAPRWTSRIIERLAEAHAPLRFNELERRARPISEKELAKRLRDLEDAGVVRRTVHAEVPPRVEYELTGSGRALVRPLAELARWAEEHRPRVPPAG
jgi:DNA-binding HxlR family transcriptional regulator